jgi:predicted DNA repair protein MutK
VNAEKATGFLASRELPVLWAISKGSFINKLVIVPIALLLNIFFPVAIIAALVLGGLYLAYEGVEKIIEFLFHRSKKGHEVIEQNQEHDSDVEKTKIKSAITTDFILSLEIVIIALGAVLDKSMPIQIITVAVVSILATVGVYGLVALIVRMDDAGYKLIKRSGDRGLLSALGHLLVKSLPVVIKILGVVGTIALVLVSGGIFIHNIEYLHHIVPEWPLLLKEFSAGFIAGLIAVGAVTGAKKIFSLVRRTS